MIIIIIPCNKGNNNSIIKNMIITRVMIVVAPKIIKLIQNG